MLMYVLIAVYVVGALAHYRFVYVRICQQYNHTYWREVVWIKAWRSYRQDHGVEAWTAMAVPLIWPAVVVFIFVYDGLKGVIESYE